MQDYFAKNVTASMGCTKYLPLSPFSERNGRNDDKSPYGNIELLQSVMVSGDATVTCTNE